MTTHTYAGYTAEQIRAAAEAAEIEATRTEQKKRQRHMRGIVAAGFEIQR